MKWHSKGRPTEVRPFLVLPLLEGERSISADGSTMSATGGAAAAGRNISSGTSTGTWPPKLKFKLNNKNKKKSNNTGTSNDKDIIERPLTATLERPELLNINLLDTLDMSLVRKEFLCITNLCKDTVNVNISVVPRSNTRVLRAGVGVLKGTRPPPAAITNTTTNISSNSEIVKRTRKPENSEDSLESDENTSVRRSRRKISKINKLIKPVQVMKKENDANNNNDATILLAAKTKPPGTNRLFARSKYTPLRSPKVLVSSPASSDDSALSTPQQAQNLPEPCTTCGRPDQPERFHSHPATPLNRRDSPRKTPQQQQPPANKSSVQKPVAIKYKPQQQRDKSPQKTQQKQTTVNATMNQSKSAKDEDKAPSVMRAPRTVICYVCGREFGTKSLPLHEPKCLEKWERENSQLPRHLQRKLPTKPDKPLTPELWNKFAWEASQAALARCENCGRTFLPDRLIVHQRSCKPNATHRPPPPRSSQNDLHLSSISPTSSGMRSIPTSPPNNGPPTIECYICGRKFGSRSIKIHEPQCLRKWHAQNDLLPVDKRKPVPSKDGTIAPVIPIEEVVKVEAQPTTQNTRPPSGPRKPMLPCYICGREYGTSSIYIHEPQCLKKWRQENEKLPVAQRRKEPERPDIKFTPSGEVDFIGTFHRIWENHLNSLVQCRKCGRNFFADRIEIHEQACNNLPIKLKQNVITKSKKNK